MKRVFFIILSTCLLWTCSKESESVKLVSFSDTGCGSELVEPETRSGDNAASQLILSYSEEGLVVTRTNAQMNCGIKNGGIACDVSVDGNVIRMHVYEKGEKMRCMCPVRKMSSTISGLGLGKDYVLEYFCGDAQYGPFEFRYDKGFQQMIDIDLYRL
ncbi:MAG: hypothetical protein IKX29_07890 [Bacteroidales bacterium]|nr:hypothetical protein [Bacteroidales bacterium]